MTVVMVKLASDQFRKDKLTYLHVHDTCVSVTGLNKIDATLPNVTRVCYATKRFLAADAEHGILRVRD